jgi:hypothetical protein
MFCYVDQQKEDGPLVARMGEKINACKVFVKEPEGNEPLRNSKGRCEDNIKMYLTEIVWELDSSGSRYGLVAGIL